MRKTFRFLLALIVGGALLTGATAFAAPDCPKHDKKSKTDKGDDDGDEGFCPKHDKKSKTDKGDDDGDEG